MLFRSHSRVASVTALMSLMCVGSGPLQDRIPVRLVGIMRKPPEHRSVAEVSLLHNMLSDLEFYRRYSVTLQLLLARVVRYQRSGLTPLELTPLPHVFYLFSLLLCSNFLFLSFPHLSSPLTFPPLLFSSLPSSPFLFSSLTSSPLLSSESNSATCVPAGWSAAGW